MAIYQNTQPTKYMVMTPRVAADMTSMMLETFGGNGTGYGAGPSFSPNPWVKRVNGSIGRQHGNS